MIFRRGVPDGASLFDSEESYEERKNIFILMVLLFCILFFPAGNVKADDTLLPTAWDNRGVYPKRYSDLVSLDDGYMRVFYRENVVYIEYYDNDFNIKSKKSIPMELDLWGGFYHGSDGYYLVEGQNNREEDDAKEVIRVIRYDRNWNKTGTAHITGIAGDEFGQVRYPFDGCVEMTELNGILYIATGHEGYVDASLGQGHQGLLVIAVDQQTMTGEIIDNDLWHSFAQYVKVRDNQLYLLEQSEGSRCTTLSRYDTAAKQWKRISVYQYGGNRTSSWAVACYASVDALEVSDTSVLGLGTSIDQTKYDTARENHLPMNIYLTVTPLDDFTEEATKVISLTNYTEPGKAFMGVKITKVNDNRFMVSWEEYNGETEGSGTEEDTLAGSTLHYVFIDGKGNRISQEYTTGAPISGCQPIVKGEKVVYYASNKNMVDFYSIDSNTGNTTKKMYHVAGEGVGWKLQNGVLTVYGNGALFLDPEDRYRFPVASSGGGYSYTQQGPWHAIQNKVKKVVICSGVTEIPERSFPYFTNLEEIEIEPGLKSIGKEAFYGCDDLEKLTIPASVTKIGEDITWTGYFWIGNYSHVMAGTIYAPYNSYAVQYAKKNALRYKIDLSNAKVSGLNASYTYTGKAITPAVTVKLGSQTLKAGEDYSLSYSDNKKVGTAELTISGNESYYGSIRLTFEIKAAASANQGQKPSEQKPSASNTALKLGTLKTDSKTKNVYKVKTASTVELKQLKNKNASTLTIPSTVRFNGKTYRVTSIAAGAFKNNKKLKKVTISGYITTIGAGAFQNCTSLTTVKTGSRVTTIGSKAFYGCRKLTTVVLGKNVKTIGNLSFANCVSLRKMTLPARVEKIGSKAFCNDVKMVSFTIQTQKLTSQKIGSKAFTNMGKNNYKKLVVKVPKNKINTCKKLLRSKGLSTRVKITK